MTIQEKLNKLSQYRITMIRHNDEWGHWRVGLNRESEEDFIAIVEKETIEECLDHLLLFYPKK